MECMFIMMKISLSLILIIIELFNGRKMQQLVESLLVEIVKKIEIAHRFHGQCTPESCCLTVFQQLMNLQNVFKMNVVFKRVG